MNAPATGIAATGIALRLARLSDPRGNFLLVPMDHGVSVGPIAGLVDPAAATRAVVSGGATGVIVHKGLVPRIAPALERSRTGLIVHLSASTGRGELNNEKVLVTSVEAAVALGADAASVHVNLGATSEDRMLADLGRTADRCHELGLPLLAMVYLRGPAVKDPFEAAGLAHAARLAEELGADLVKVNYSGSVESFRTVVGGVGIPVLIAGGERMNSTEAFLRVAAEAGAAGARGISVGRNIWQADDPEKTMAAVRELFARGAGPEAR